MPDLPSSDRAASGCLETDSGSTERIQQEAVRQLLSLCVQISAVSSCALWDFSPPLPQICAAITNTFQLSHFWHCRTPGHAENPSFKLTAPDYPASAAPFPCTQGAQAVGQELPQAGGMGTNSLTPISGRCERQPQAAE